jgi:PfaB family protein
MLKSGLDSPLAAGDVKLAITGMDVYFAACDGLGAFERLIITGGQISPTAAFTPPALSPAEQALWALSSAQLAALSAEDRLLLKLASRLRLTDSADLNTDILYAQGGALAAGLAERFGLPSAGSPTSQLDSLPGFVCDLSQSGNFLAALREAQTRLRDGSAEVVILAASALEPDFRALLTPAGVKVNSGVRTLGFDKEVDGWNFGSGAVALALMRAERAVELGKTIYATIDGIGHTTRGVAAPKKHLVPSFVSGDTVLSSAQLALQQAGINPAEVGYLETLASGFAPLDSAEMGGLSRAYATANPDLTCAVGSIQANTGYLLSASALASLIRAAVCVHNRVIPATRFWTAPKKPEHWTQTPFYISSDQHTWFQPQAAPLRKAAVSSIGWDGSCTHLILSESPHTPAHPHHAVAHSPFYLFPVAGNSQVELLSALTSLRASLEGADQPFASARAAFETFRQAENPVYAAAFVGQNLDEVRKEIDNGLRDIPGAFEKGRTWQTPLGSSFSPSPVGASGSVAFVYPGAFNSYLGLGRDLFTLYPQIYARAVALTADISKTIQERKLYPRSIESLSKEQLQELETQLNADPIAMITSGSIISVLFTMILQNVFKIQASTAFGYSLGEIGMLFASGIWDNADEIAGKLSRSPLFHDNIAGPQNAIRAHWGLPMVDQAPQNPIWANYFLMTSAENVVRAVENEPRVYLTHINTPRQVVIGGDPEGCQRVIAALKCTSLRAPFDFALHCQAMASEYSELTTLLNWPIAHTPATQLYTAAGFAPLPIERNAVASSISRMLCERIDFPTLVRQVYASGARVFIELGANANCSKWIDDILKTEPAVSAAINRKGVDDHTSIVRLLAKLVSQRVPLDLSPLYA